MRDCFLFVAKSTDQITSRFGCQSEVDSVVENQIFGIGECGGSCNLFVERARIRAAAFINVNAVYSTWNRDFPSQLH